jgi:hypothetical protein
VLEINEVCNEHHEKFIAYCKEHERPCCRICILENHKHCKEVTILENIIDNIKTSHIFNEIERSIDELIETIGKIRQNRETNDNVVKEQKILVENEIRKLRTKIDKHFDKLQEGLMKELTEKENGITIETRELLVSLDEKQKELIEYQINIVNIKKYASDLKGRWMRGCPLLPDGRMVLSCFETKSVSFINKEGVYIEDNNRVAVSSGLGRNKCITIIAIESQKVMTTISNVTTIYGMAVRSRTIYYCTGNKGLRMLNFNDKSVSDIINSDMSGVFYVATSGEKLYYTDYYAGTVTCCDLHGTTQWEFTDEHGLRGSSGISVDNDGNVYVVGYHSSNVVVISPDVQRHRQLLSSENGLKEPRVIDYNKSTNMLLVVNNNRTAFLFDVTRRE